MTVKLSDSDKNGSARAKSSFTVNENSGGAALKLKLHVRKSGMSGSGKGTAQAVLMNNSWKPMFTMKLRLTVGADSWDGSASKSKSESVYLRAKKMDEVAGWVFKCDCENNNGIADDIQGLISDAGDFLKDVIKDPTSVLDGIDSGDTIDLKSGWQFYKR